MFLTSHKAASLAARFLLAALPALAQTDFGRISGSVTDPSGAVVTGASVIVRNTDTQATRSLTTDEHGFYVAGNLPIGPYAVEVNHPGFKRSTQSGFNLVADGRITADVRLEVGDTSQTVEVTGVEGDVLNTVSGELSRVIDTRQVDNLALNGRNYMELLTLVPGAVVTNPDQFSVTTSLSATNQVVNGHRSDSNNLTVDGLFNMDGGSNGSLINNVSADFTQEVKIQTSNFSAEYGRSGGVAFNIVTRNGTNQFHGGAFEYFRNDALDARNFFSPNNTELRFNDFGYSVGGPIRKNKIFFFGGQEWKRLRQQSAPVRETLPTTLELAGNFTGSGKTIDQPGTKTPFPGDMIPASLLTPNGQAIANIYRTVIPQAAIFTNTPTSNNTTFEVPNPLNYREDLIRVDYRINDKHTMYARWVDDYNSIYLAYGPSSTTGTYVPITPEIRNRPGKSGLLSETWVISSTLVNEAHVGASWNSQHYLNQGDTWQRSTQGFTYPKIFNTVGEYPNGIPDVSITSFATIQGPDHTLTSPTTEIEGADTVSIIRGSQTIRAGVMLIRNRKDQNGRSAYDGSATFNTSGNPNTTGYALADALTGNFNTYQEAAYDPIGHMRYTEPAAFVDDSWKASRKLTINFGLRFEYMMAAYSAANNLTNFVPALYNPGQAVKLTSSGNVVPGSGNIYDGLQRAGAGVPSSQAYLVPNASSAAVLDVPAGAPRGLYNGGGTWAPRAGFAYALTNKTIIRGGFGLFYDRMEGNVIFPTLNNPPFVGSTEYVYGNLSNITAGGTVSAPWGTIQTIQPNMKTPYSEQFSLSIQRELPKRLFLEASYVGTLGRHLLREPDINFPNFALYAANQALASPLPENNIRPYAGYSTIQQYTSDSTSNYHALQVFLSRRAGSVLFTTAYTFSKALGDSSGETDNAENYQNRHFNYGPLSFDARHAFVGTFIWDLPKLTRQSAFIRGPFGAWQMSGVIRLQTGFYYTVTGSTSEGTRRSDYLGGATEFANPGANAWWIPAAFATAPNTRYGNAGSGDIEGPGLQAYDLSVTKFIKTSEKTTLRVRADFFNAFNCVNFQAPNATVTSSAFGTIAAAYPPRNIQLGLKLIF